jgi:hypothetical protein
LKTGRIKARFIRCKPEDTFNSAVIDRRYSHAPSANPAGFQSTSPRSASAPDLSSSINCPALPPAPGFRPIAPARLSSHRCKCSG